TDLASGAPDVIRHDGGTLHADIGDAYWKKLVGAVGADDAQRLDKLKPMMTAVELETRSFPQTTAMDAVLSGHALNAHKQMVYLEPLEKQIAILDKWMDARAIKEQLDDLDSADLHAKEMLAAYIAGDDAK